MALAIQAANEAIAALPEVASLILADEGAVQGADALVQTAIGLGASPEMFEDYEKLQASKARMANRSLSFNGMNNYVAIEHATELNPDSITIEAWIKPESFTKAAGIVSKYHTSATPSYSLRLSEEPGKDGHIEFTINDNGNWWDNPGQNKPNALVSDSAVTLDEWTHVAAVFNADGGKMELYINGQLNGEKSGAIMAKNNSPVNIGRDFAARHFDGSIDEVRIWNMPRTAEQISGAKDLELTGEESGLVGLWNFNKSTGENAAGNNHNGTIVGAEPQLNN